MNPSLDLSLFPDGGCGVAAASPRPPLRGELEYWKW